jgi:drug/metabolite transporter (DMT)-like permease
VIILEFLGAILVIIGVFYISKPKRVGLWWMLGAQIVWIIYSAVTGLLFLTVQSSYLLYLNIRGLINWKKKGIE